MNKPHDRFTFRKLRAKGSSSGGDKVDTSEGWPTRLVSPNHPARNYLVQLANSDPSHSEEWWRDLFRALDIPESDPDEEEGEADGDLVGAIDRLRAAQRQARSGAVAAMDETEEEYDESEVEGLHTFLGGPGLSLTPEGRSLTRNQLIEGLRGQGTPDLQAIARESLIATQRGDHPIVALLPVDTIEIHYQGALSEVRFIDFLRHGQRIARQNIAPLQGEGTTHVRLENLVMFLPVTGTLGRA